MSRQVIRQGRGGENKRTKEGKKERSKLSLVVVEKGRFYHSEAIIYLANSKSLGVPILSAVDSSRGMTLQAKL